MEPDFEDCDVDDFPDDQPDEPFYYECDDDEDIDVDTCLGCGRATGVHPGVLAWDQRREGCIAPQLCPRCWIDQGHPWPSAP
ncbi:hypothetical protein PBR31_00043 [Xanthomonas phage PBR31]|uniref:Uncharacterized protein n=1 Tax=Xanthomonas phage PPDBI TaxID=2723911 RepID=A0A6H0X5T1_9CAUD|nr:hypothetical protein PBR31_00043 [Xanthomonas phage PBR31]QIW89402.1 hypothetical protein PPDBI_00043 [Xanthomonas phage PPDBI]